MTPPNDDQDGRAYASALATIAALAGCVITAVHLVLGGTSSLALAGVNPFRAWPYILGFGLAMLGILLHASQPVSSRNYVAITIGAGLLGVLTLPIAWLYFGFAGIGVDTNGQVTALLSAFTAAVVPVVMVFVGGVVSWRSREKSRQYRLRLMAVVVGGAVILSVGCIFFARLFFPATGAG